MSPLLRHDRSSKILFLALVSLFPSTPWASGQDGEAAKSSVGKKIEARDLSDAFRSASQRVLPAVVTILGNSKEVNKTLENLDLVDDASRFDIVGSGVILDAKGLIVTNHHVVAEAKELTVRLDDGREFKGDQVRSDESSDLAILRMVDCPEGLVYAKVGDSESLSVGDWVLSIGSPFNFEQTVSAGIVSGKSRVLQGSKLRGQLLQTDAAINPGNSGGALVNLDGEVVGINTAIATRSGTFSGVGFAIPASRLKWITSELVERGKVRRARIGVRAEPLPKDVADDLKLPIRGGIIIASVSNGLPADKAGFKVGDVIVEVAGQKIRTKNDFSDIVEQLPIDQAHTFKFIRGGEVSQADVTPIEKEDRR